MAQHRSLTKTKQSHLMRPKLRKAFRRSVQLTGETEPLLVQRARIAPHTLTPTDILHLQRAIGNRAVQRLLVGVRQPMAGRVQPQVAQTNNPAIQRWSPFKKKKKEPEISRPTEVRHMGQPIESSSDLKEKLGYTEDFIEAGPKDRSNFSQMLANVVGQVVSNLPVPDENDIPDQSKIREAEQTGSEIGNELKPLVEGNEPLAEIILEILGQKSANEPEPPKRRPWYKRLFGKKPRLEEDQKVKNAQKWAGRRGKLGTANIVVSKGGVGLGQTQNALKLLGQQATASSSVVKGISDVMPVVNIIFGAITAIFDFRAGFSSVDKGVDLELMLEKAEQEADEEGYDPEVIKAVRYAIEQKYSKFYKRHLAGLTGLAATGASIAIVAAGGGIAALLASNPVGWGIAVGLIGLGALYGLGLFIYKIGRWIFKKKKGILGKKRNQMAAVLFDKMTHGDEIAIKALSILGVKPGPEEMQSTYDQIDGKWSKKKYRQSAIKLIMRKLKSA